MAFADFMIESRWRWRQQRSPLAFLPFLKSNFTLCPLSGQENTLGRERALSFGSAGSEHKNRGGSVYPKEKRQPRWLCRSTRRRNDNRGGSVNTQAPSLTTCLDPGDRNPRPCPRSGGTRAAPSPAYLDPGGRKPRSCPRSGGTQAAPFPASNADNPKAIESSAYLPGHLKNTDTKWQTCDTLGISLREDDSARSATCVEKYQTARSRCNLFSTGEGRSSTSLKKIWASQASKVILG